MATHGDTQRSCRWAILLVTAAALASGPVPATGHWERAEDVIAELRSPKVRSTFDIVEVARHEGVPRLLVIRVGQGWHDVAPPTRRTNAEQWMTRWRHAVPQGIVAIVDNTTGDSVVNFDAHGHAILKDAAVTSRGSSSR